VPMKMSAGSYVVTAVVDNEEIAKKIILQ